jgi:RNA polymerase sigma factor (sigma-70 family)
MLIGRPARGVISVENQVPGLLRRFRRLAEATGIGALTDCQLLVRFVATRDEAAFEVLVWRHGALVYGLCRRLLRHDQDAEDAFQATFLALARKAASVRNGEALASWLYKVAYRIAMAARAAPTGKCEPLQSDVAAVTSDETDWRDLRPVLDEEVNRLPAKYRAPFILCYLEGRTNEDAARQLGCPKGTVLSRLARARQRLRARLTRRGVSTTMGAVTLAVPPTHVVEAAVEGAVSTGVGRLSARVAALTEGALRTMSKTKMTTAAAVFFVAGLVGVAALGNGPLARSRDTLPAENTPVVSRAVARAPEAEPEADDTVEIAMRRTRSAQNFKQVGVALLGYHDAYGCFPAPAIYDKNGKALLSWRVALLPYLDQEKLYKRFRLDEPWDSPHNKKLLAEMPSVFAPAATPSGDPGRTFYQAFVGPHAGFEAGKKLSLVSFTDGTDQIIFMAEAASPVPWTKPDDLPIATDRPLPKLGGQFAGHFHVLMVDGTVRFVPKNVDPRVLRDALTRDKLLSKKGEAADAKADNERLFKLLVQSRGALEQEKAVLAELRAKLAKLATESDAKKDELMLDRAALQNQVRQRLQQLDEVRAERVRLERLLEERASKKQ